MSNKYHTWDILLTPDGDFALDSSGDLAIAQRNELIVQVAQICLKTTNPDWFIGDIGADLEDLLGMENSRETAELGIAKIKEALMKTEFFEEEDIWVEATPINKSTIVFFLFINSPFSEDPMVYRIDLDLSFGSTVRRVA